MTIDIADAISALVEVHDRRALDADLIGGLVFSSAGVATAGAAWTLNDPTPQRRRS